MLWSKNLITLLWVNKNWKGWGLNKKNKHWQRTHAELSLEGVVLYLECVWARFFQLQCQVDSPVNSCPQAMNKEFTIPGEEKGKEHKNSFTLIDNFASGLPQCAHTTRASSSETNGFKNASQKKLRSMKWKLPVHLEWLRVVSSPDPTHSRGETIWWTKSNFLG